MRYKSSNNDITRRRFVKTAASSAAAFAVMRPGTALGTEANSRITAGIIGLGGRGTMIAGMVQKHGGYEITAVADYFPEVVNAAGKSLQVDKKRRFSGLHGYRKLIDSGVDAVFLKAPPYCFPEHCAAAVDAGCHVYVAKPLGCDVPGCLSIAASAKRAGEAQKVFLVDFQTRTDPFFIEGIKRIRQGDFGAIGLIGSVYTDDGFEDPPLTATIESRLQSLIWVNDINLGGGYLVNAGIHALDVGLWIAGQHPESAMGSARLTRAYPHGDSMDAYSLSYQFKNGLVMNHWGEHLRNQFGFRSDNFAQCQGGYLEAGYTTRVRIRGNSDGYRGGDVEALYTRGAERNIDQFQKSIADGRYDNPTVEPGVNATLASILGREAGHRSALVTWDRMIEENKRCEVDTSGLTL